MSAIDHSFYRAPGQWKVRPALLRFGLEHVLDGGFDEFLERWQMDIREPLDVDAALTARMFAELRQQFIAAFKARRDIKRDILFARRKCHLHPIAFATAGVFVVTATETNDAGTPHFRRGVSGFLHNINNHPTVLANLFVLDRIKKVVDRSVIAFCFDVNHRVLQSSFYLKRVSALPLAETVTKPIRRYYEKDFVRSVAVPVDAEAGICFSQAIRLQFREGGFNVVHLEETSFLGRVPSVFSQTDLYVVSGEHGGLTWRIFT